jgi:hypothetical protein
MPDQDRGYFLHGRQVTKAELARYVAEQMVAEVEAAYLAEPSQLGSDKAADAEGDRC